MVHVRTCKVLKKYINAFLSYSAKTKRDGQMDGWTDRRGALQYLPSRAFGAAGDNKNLKLEGSIMTTYMYELWFGVLWYYDKGGRIFFIFPISMAP